MARERKWVYFNCDQCWNIAYMSQNKYQLYTHHFCCMKCRDDFHHSKYKSWDRYCKLTLMEILDEKKGKFRSLRCKCDCWNETIIALWNWGYIKSCWCLWWKITHGKTKSDEYKIWRWLLDRCNKETHYAYKDYWGRWIKVWFKDFDEFYAYIWPRPWMEYTVDRIDNSKGYEPWNVRWATMKEQSNNRRSNVKCIINWEEHTLQEWADKLWMNRKTLKRYILKWKIKWDVFNYTVSTKWR